MSDIRLVANRPKQAGMLGCPQLMRVTRQERPKSLIQLRPVENIHVGDEVASPAGRVLKIADVFVPKNSQGRHEALPAKYRNFSRKLVIFDNGTMAPLSEIKARYKSCA